MSRYINERIILMYSIKYMYTLVFKLKNNDAFERRTDCRRINYILFLGCAFRTCAIHENLMKHTDFKGLIGFRIVSTGQIIILFETLLLSTSVLITLSLIVLHVVQRFIQVISIWTLKLFNRVHLSSELNSFTHDDVGYRGTLYCLYTQQVI